MLGKVAHTGVGCRGSCSDELARAVLIPSPRVDAIEDPVTALASGLCEFFCGAADIGENSHGF